MKGPSEMTDNVDLTAEDLDNDPEIMMSRLRRLGDDDVPSAATWPNSFFLYADHYYRRTPGLPLRERAAGRYYLDDDTYGVTRTLPFTPNPLVKTALGFRVAKD